MPQGHERMFIEHAWARKSHDFLYPLAHVFFITMDGAVATCWFILLKRTTKQFFVGMVQEVFAISAEFILFCTMVMCLTVNYKHCFDCLELSGQARVRKNRGAFCVCRGRGGHGECLLVPCTSSFVIIASHTCSCVKSPLSMVMSAYLLYRPSRSSKRSSKL